MTSGWQPRPWRFARASWDWSRPYVMGVVNVTPDSFSDGGHFAAVDSAIAHAIALDQAGADVIDIGGESTRPGAEPVPASVELGRVLPVIEGLAGQVKAVISIDTTKAQVARAAIAAGAELINDISGGQFETAIAPLAEESGAKLVCGHVRGRSLAEVHQAESQPLSFAQVCADLARQLENLPDPVKRRTIVDPGLGFGKGAELNLELCRRSGEIAAALEYPVMVGPSRKRFVGALTGTAVAERDAGTIGACLAAIRCGAHMVRVHDVGAMVQAIAAYRAVMGDAR